MPVRHVFVSELKSSFGPQRSLRSKGSVAFVLLTRSQRLWRLLMHGVKRVGKRDAIQPIILVVTGNRGIDIEYYRHLALFAGRHGLLGEAETVDLLEIRANRERGDIIGRLPGRGPRGL